MGIIASFVQTWHRVNQRFFLARRLKHPFVSQSQWSGPLPPNPRCPTDVPARCSPSLRCNPSKLLSGVMHFSEVQSTEEYSLVRHYSVEPCSGDVATLVSSKTRSVQTGLSKVLQGSGATPCRGGAGQTQVSRPSLHGRRAPRKSILWQLPGVADAISEPTFPVRSQMRQM